MEAVANLVVAAADLMEAEGRSLRRNLVRLLVAGMVTFVATALLLVGLGFVLYGMFLALAERMSRPEAASTFGLACILLSLLGAWTVRRLVR